MKARLGIIVLALLTASCGESRYQGLTGPLPTPGTTGGGGGGGGGNNCNVVATNRTCVGKGGSDPILSGVVVSSTSTVLTLKLPAEYSSDREAQAFKAVLIGPNGERYEFRRPGDPCPVVDDIAGFDGLRTRDMGQLTGVAPGTYELRVEHGLDDPCYHPPAGADRNASNWIVIESGELTICN